MSNNRTGFDIVWYLSGDWETDHRRQMIMSFAENMISYGKVLCVNRPVCLLTSPFLKTRKLFKWITGQLTLRKQSRNLYIYTPFVFIHDQLALKIRIFAHLNKKILSFSLRRVINKIGFRGRLLLSWIYVPTQYDYPGIAGDIEFVYECYDKYSEFRFPLMPRRRVVYYDRILAENALLVFNTARKLYEEKIKINRNSFYIPNAVNVNMFTGVAKRGHAIPRDMEHLRHPIVGFMGNIHANFVDCELIKELAFENPLFSFVFLGELHKSNEVNTFINMPNVHYLGPKKYEDVPSYVLSFDIGIIPFKINEITRNLNPLKIYEFMAAGCPVVATDIPELQSYSGLIDIAKSREDFNCMLRKMLSKDREELRVNLLNEVWKHSWDRRTAEMVFRIEECINRKYDSSAMKVSQS